MDDKVTKAAAKVQQSLTILNRSLEDFFKIIQDYPSQIATNITSIQNIDKPILNVSDVDWPEAVPNSLIIDSTTGHDRQKKRLKARQILNLFRTDLSDKIVLDVGCGEGYLTSELSIHCKKVFGYDLTTYDEYPIDNSYKIDKIKYINSLDNIDVKFDMIILYDVIDHVVNINMSDFLASLKKHLHHNGTMFLRCHPWTSRHGGHWYEFINKAYIHLLLTEEELFKAIPASTHDKVRRLLFTGGGVSKLLRPLSSYESAIKNAGLSILSRQITNEEVPDYMDQFMPKIIDLNWGGKIDSTTAKKIMSMSFIDYKLAHLDHN